MISNRRLRDLPTVHAARQLAQLLQVARVSFPPAARVCPKCQHVFSLQTRLDMRCPGCARAALSEPDPPGDDCPKC